VDAALVLFFAMTVVNLVLSTANAVANTTDGDYAYLIPASLYLLLFIAFIIYNRIRNDRTDSHATIGDLIWGLDDAVGSQVVFLLVSLGLIFWMNAVTNNLFAVYIPLFGQTIGMLSGKSGRIRLSITLVTIEAGALLYQIGFLDDVFHNRATFGEIVGISISVISFTTLIMVIMALIRSRMESEGLIQELRITHARLEAAQQKENEVAVLRERERMAREMHDVLGHALVLVAVKIEAAQRLLAVDPARGNQELEDTKELVRQSMSDLRTSLADLRGPSFDADAQPLSKALSAWATRTAQESKMQIECNFEPETDNLPPQVQDALWRVGREAILNVVKHARAHTLRLATFMKGGSAYLTIADDGVGIPRLREGSARLEVEGHYGIRGMRERIEAINGHLTLKPGQNERGTIVIASVPVTSLAREEGKE
jgi:signal transduction histidine kinase